jgi:hypothetical protein
MLYDLNAFVDRYYARLFNQLNRNNIVHNSSQPVRDAYAAIAYMTVEKHKNCLLIAKDMRSLNYKLLAFDTYAPIDVNEFMEGLQTQARYRFMDTEGRSPRPISTMELEEGRQ